MHADTLGQTPVQQGAAVTLALNEGYEGMGQPMDFHAATLGGALELQGAYGPVTLAPNEGYKHYGTGQPIARNPYVHSYRHAQS